MVVTSTSLLLKFTTLKIMPNLKFDSLIFDLDGTLWDSSAVCAEAWNRALENLNVPSRKITVDDIGKIMGMPHKQVFETVFPDTDERAREEIANQCYAEEIAAIRDEGAALYAGVVDGLQALAARYPLYIVSNCMADYLNTFFEYTGMRHLFKDSECHGATGMGKADNIMLLKNRNGLVSPAYIGDTSGDQDAALRAGVVYFHVEYGFGDPTKPCTRFPHFNDVTKFFLDAPAAGQKP